MACVAGCAGARDGRRSARQPTPPKAKCRRSFTTSASALFLSGLLAIAFARLRLPAIAGYILAGVVAGPLALGLVTDSENIDTIAQLGFVLLLFVIGLEIDVGKILKSGRRIILTGLMSIPAHRRLRLHRRARPAAHRLRRADRPRPRRRSTSASSSPVPRPCSSSSCSRKPSSSTPCPAASRSACSSSRTSGRSS